MENLSLTCPIYMLAPDIDILAIDKTGKEGIFCECKYRNRPMPMEEYDDLVTAAAAFPQITKGTLCSLARAATQNPSWNEQKKKGLCFLG